MGATPDPPAFRLAEKHFKNRATRALPALRSLPRDLCAPVLDLSRPLLAEDDPVWRAGWWGGVYDPEARPRRPKERVRGDRPELELGGVRAVKLADGRTGFVVAEGCLLIPGYLDAGVQENLLLAALASYTLPPNPLSLDTHYAVPPNLFSLYATHPEHLVPPRHTQLEEEEKASHAAAAGTGRRTGIETAPAAAIGYDEVKRRNATFTGDAVSLKVGAKSVAQLMREIRWANLGWIYKWSTKSYDFSSETPIPFPPDLATLCQRAVGSVPWGEVFAGSDDEPDWPAWRRDYKPDTGLVNYYQRNDTLMGHIDRAELDPARPLVSISLGHAALFLLGTSTRSTPPTPLILRSGDILLMSGTGRQSYHGVPRILEDTLPDHFIPRDEDGEEMRAAKRWITTARVNISARQVFPPGFERQA